MGHTLFDVINKPHPVDERMPENMPFIVNNEFITGGFCVIDVFESFGGGPKQKKDASFGEYSFTEKGAQALAWMLPPTLHWARHNPIYQFTPQLLTMMDNTEIDDSIPASIFKLPYPSGIYIHIGNDPETERLLSDTNRSNNNEVVGVYVFSASQFSQKVEKLYQEKYGQSPQAHYDLIWVIAGRSNDNPSEFHHGVVFSSLEITDLNKPILEFVNVSGASMLAEYMLDDGLDELSRAQNAQTIKEHVDLIVKLLLYCNCKQARIEEHPEYTQLMEEASAKKGKKRKIAERRAAQKWDYIRVGPEDYDQETGEPTGTTKTAHWRRGHFRMQKYGPKLALKKLIFIEPTLVGAKGVTEEINKKDYIAY